MILRSRDEQETRNALSVLEWIQHLATQPDLPLDLNLICHVNRLTLQFTDRHVWAGRVRSEVDWHQPGDWSRLRAVVANEQEQGLVVRDEHTGEIIVKFPADRDVGPMLELLIQWIQSPRTIVLHPVVRAAIFHQRFTAIHPFRDGNGRTARALTILLFWRDGFPVDILALQRVLDQRRDAYIDGLRAADKGNMNQWLEFFGRSLRDALAHSMNE